MFFVEGYDRSTGKSWFLNEHPETMREAQIIAGNMNSMEARKTDGVIYVNYTAKEVKEDAL